MTVYKTLAQLQKYAKSTQSNKAGTKKFLTVKPNENVNLRVRQELSEDAKNYNPDRGTGIAVQIHTNPDNFKKRGRCTSSTEGKCYGCSQVTTNPKWNAKSHYLINVLIKNDGAWEPRILDQTFGPTHVMNQLLEYASVYKTVTTQDFQMGRTGERLNTTYLLIPLGESKTPEEDATLELFDLDAVYPEMTYEQQVDFYTAVDENESNSAGKW